MEVLHSHNSALHSLLSIGIPRRQKDTVVICRHKLGSLCPILSNTNIAVPMGCVLELHPAVGRKSKRPPHKVKEHMFPYPGTAMQLPWNLDKVYDYIFQHGA